MTTATANDNREWLQRRRANHHRALETLITNGQSGLQVWRKLRRIEKRANSFAVAYCNGNIDSDDWEVFTQEFTESVTKVFGKLPQGFFVNGDPRGYALKLDNEKVTIPEGMHTDWGGYGILGAEID